jgi:hypothetical protein
MTRQLHVRTAGTGLTVENMTRRQAEHLARAVDASPGPPAHAVDVRVVLEQGRHRFDTDGMVPVTRGVWSSKDAVVFESVGGSGYTQSWHPEDEQLTVRTRWAPSLLEQGATVLGGRADALQAQVLVHYPALWWAGLRGLAPLHVSVLEIDGVVVVLGGPGGVGKSTLVADALASGARATCDNLAACDADVAYGLREPLRLSVADGAPSTGNRTTHGRREVSWTARVPALRPDLVVVVRRGDGPRVRTIPAEEARRSLVAGTYAAGELRRFWALTALVGLATGRGPVRPWVEEAAHGLASRLPCVELELGTTPGLSLRETLAPYLADVDRHEVGG